MDLSIPDVKLKCICHNNLTYSHAKHTNMNLCGCSSTTAPPFYFPDPKNEDDLKCLASYRVAPLTLMKRLPTLSYPTQYGSFSCSTSYPTQRPFQDCINLIGAYCKPLSPIFKSWSDCQAKILHVSIYLNSNWKGYVNSCARFAGLGGSSPSAGCTIATNIILTGEFYKWYDDKKMEQQSLIPDVVTQSLALYIFNT